MLSDPPKLRMCLWFQDRAVEAAEFYVSLLPESRVDKATELDGNVVVIELTLANVPYMLLQAGDRFRLSPAASISVTTDDQAETDHLWDSLTADGGAESMCGWLTDRFGVSWQITPRRLLELQASRAADAVRAAMYKMKKIEIAVLERAAAAA